MRKKKFTKKGTVYQEKPGKSTGSQGLEEEAAVPVPSRTYKARLFEMVFSQKKELLELYNAVNGTEYNDPEQLEINTLENAIYMSMHNDLSFIIDSRLEIYEHQSTYSPNLPLRCLMYVADLYSKITKEENLYGSKRIPIPTPQFLIFYNGEEERPDKERLKLSDLYTITDKPYALELEAVMLNINPGHNVKLLDTCRTLRDYSEYTYRVRMYAKEMPLNMAVERAITECIKEGILAEFLQKNRAEAKKVSIYEYDEEKHMRFVRQEGYEDGLEEGRKEGYEKGEKDFVRRLEALSEALKNDGRIEELFSALKDKEVREALFREYKI